MLCLTNAGLFLGRLIFKSPLHLSHLLKLCKVRPFCISYLLEYEEPVPSLLKVSLQEFHKLVLVDDQSRCCPDVELVPSSDTTRGPLCDNWHDRSRPGYAQLSVDLFIAEVVERGHQSIEPVN